MNITDTTDIKNKYPTSKNGYSCIGPCYHPDTVSIHPLYLEHIVNRNKSYCPTAAYTVPGETEPNIYDECTAPTHKKNEPANIEMLSLSSMIEFSDDSFLRIYYEIYSLEDAVKWITERNYMPIASLNRVLNTAFKVYGKQLEIIDNRIVDYIDNIFKHHIRTISEKALKYVGVDNNEVILVESIDHQNKHIDERIKYIENMFINKDTIYKFITRYFKTRNSEWHTIDNHISRMISDMSDYIEKKIKVTLEI